MPRLTRRTFLTAIAAALPAEAFIRLAHAAAVDDLAGLSPKMQALGEAVLPAELGRARIAAIVDQFQRWITGYREHAELVHGYGTSKLEWTGPTPATRWATQLDELDRAAARDHGRPFASVPIVQRQALVSSALTFFKEERIPPVGRCPHVALALLAHFYASDAATDLCYDAQIMRENCRPLAMSSRKPLPLAKRGRA